MNRTFLSCSLVVCGAMLAYACSSKDDASDAGTNPQPDGGDTDSNPGDDGGADTEPTDGAISPSGNPIEGIAAAAEIAALAGLVTEGPQWHVDGLYFSTAVLGGSFIKLTPPSTTQDFLGVTAGNVPLGNAFDKAVGVGGTFVSCEAVAAGAGGILVRRTLAGAATPITLTFAGSDAFASPNDVVARADGTLYVTDPGYQAGAASADNKIWRVKPNGDVVPTPAGGRPNGIALSPDEKSLYVSFTAPDAPALPMIMKYAIATDGTIGGVAKFNDVGPVDSLVDGLAVDTSGNVYAAVKNGVDVFKADGSGKWGHIATTKVVSGLAFGGADKKTLYMTTDTGMLQVTVKIAGIE